MGKRAYDEVSKGPSVKRKTTKARNAMYDETGQKAEEAHLGGISSSAAIQVTVHTKEDENMMTGANKLLKDFENLIQFRSGSVKKKTRETCLIQLQALLQRLSPDLAHSANTRYDTLFSKESTNKTETEKLREVDDILRWAELSKFPFRTDPFKPTRLFADHEMCKTEIIEGTTVTLEDKQRVCFDREHVTEVAIWHLTQALSAIPETQEGSGFCATMGGRGTGKTFLIDHLCCLNDSVRNNGQPALGKLKDKLVPLPISFNGPMEDHSGLKGMGKISSRLFYSAFIDGNNLKFPKFLRNTNNVDWEEVDLAEVFNKAYEYFLNTLGVSSPIIFIAVDEVVKTGDDALNIISALKELLAENANRCRLLMSTFDDQMLHQEDTWSAIYESKTSSGRPITWLPLKPLSLRNVFPYVRRCLSKETLSDAELNFLLSISGGHPRSLAILKKILTFSALPRVSVKTVTEAWVYQMWQYFEPPSNFDSFIFDLLACSVLGQRLVLDDVLSDGITTVRLLVSKTFLINAVDPLLLCVEENNDGILGASSASGAGFVPQVSPLLLELRKKLYNDRVYSLIDALLRLSKEEPIGTTFEVFHLHFQQLRCWAWHHLRVISKNLQEKSHKDWTKGLNPTLHGFFPCAEFITCEEERDSLLDIPNKVDDVSVDHYTNLVKFRCKLTLPPRATSDLQWTTPWVLCKSNQPGFDMIEILGNWAILTECKSSAQVGAKEDIIATVNSGVDIRKDILTKINTTLDIIEQWDS